MFLIVILLATIVTASLAHILDRLAASMPRLSRRLRPAPRWLPALAAGCFLAAFFLPDIHISPETTTFQQHFIGGGVYSALLYIYVLRRIGWRSGWWLELLLLFGWTSALGVAAELAEFSASRLQLVRIGTDDTDWDLLANTSGALLAYALYRVVLAVSAGRRS